MDLFFALDAGTTGVRTVAFSTDLRVIHSSYRPLRQYFPHPGEVEHDADEILELAVATVADVAAQAAAHGDRPVALGITNQRETTIAFDPASGRPLARALVWQDRRTSALVASWRDAGVEPLVRSSTGLVLDPYFSASKIHWLIREGHVGARAHFATVDTWLLWHLTGGPDGGVFATEPSNASRTMLMDLATRTWSPPLLELVGVDPGALAEIRPSASHFGVVRHAGLHSLEGLAITGILGDQQAALFGQACFAPGMVKATYGTGSFVLVHAGVVPPPTIDGLLTTLAWDLGGDVAYAYEGSAFVAGAAVDWFADVGLLAEPTSLDARARGVPDSAGVIVIPAFTGLGSPFWRPDARGAIVGLSQATTRDHVARALVDALAFQVRAMADAAPGITLSELRADGGVAQVDLLLQLQADALRVPVVRGATVESTARGAASIAAWGSGYFTSLDDLAATWQVAATFTPASPETVDAGYRAWRRAAERISSDLESVD